MTKYAVYNEIGHIVQFVSAPEESVAEMCAYKGSWWFVKVNDSVSETSHYCAEGEALIRPINPTTISSNTLSNLPCPCKVVIDGQEYECNEPTATLGLGVGKYKVRVVKWPYLDAEFEVVV